MLCIVKHFKNSKNFHRNLETAVCNSFQIDDGIRSHFWRHISDFWQYLIVMSLLVVYISTWKFWTEGNSLWSQKVYLTFSNSEQKGIICDREKYTLHFLTPLAHKLKPYFYLLFFLQYALKMCIRDRYEVQ